VDRSRCTGCGLCAVICPINIIRMESGKPEGICMNCGACAASCPAGARIKVGAVPICSASTIQDQDDVRCEGLVPSDAIALKHLRSKSSDDEPSAYPLELAAQAHVCYPIIISSFLGVLFVGHLGHFAAGSSSR